MCHYLSRSNWSWSSEQAEMSLCKDRKQHGWHLRDPLRYHLVFPHPSLMWMYQCRRLKGAWWPGVQVPLGRTSGSTHHVIPKSGKMLVKVNLDLVKKKKKGWFQVQLQDHLWRWGWSLFLLQVILGNMNNMNPRGRVSIIYYIKYVELKRTKGRLEWLPWCATKLYLNVLVTDNFILSSLFEFSSVKKKCLTQGNTVSPGHSASNDTMWWCKCLISFHKEGYSEGPSQHSCPWIDPDLHW